MTVVSGRDNLRHLVASLGERSGWGRRMPDGSWEHDFDPRVGWTACGLHIALVLPRCPDTPGHRIAVPGCPLHERPRLCPECYTF